MSKGLPPTSAVVFELARPDDEPQLRRVLRDNPMEGAVSVAFEREPAFGLAATLEGPVHQTVVARAPGDQVVGLCSRSVRSLWLNGQATELGYLSMLRLDRAWRGRRRMLLRGFERCHALHQADARAPFYMTTIIEDNSTARRFLGANLKGFPRYTEQEVLVTLAIPTWRRRRGPALPSGSTLRQGTPDDLGAIAACLQQLQRYQLAPVWTEDDLRSELRCRGLRPQDFVVALREEAVVGCVALWDQQAFKQSVVCAYEGGLSRYRGLVNLAAPWVGVPRLPAPGQRFRHAALSHLAYPEGEESLALALLSSAYETARGGDYDYLTLGLAERDPLQARARRHFKALEYRSVLYLVSWDDGHDAVARVDARVPRPEVAVL